jgi:hypothetical protein
MPWKECNQMDERLKFIARELVSMQERPASQAVLVGFPMKINRETFSRIREFSDRIREFK